MTIAVGVRVGSAVFVGVDVDVELGVEVGVAVAVGAAVNVEVATTVGVAVTAGGGITFAAIEPPLTTSAIPVVAFPWKFGSPTRRSNTPSPSTSPLAREKP